MQINDEVFSKTGTIRNVAGTIVAIYDASFYIDILREKIVDFTPWSTEYPGWEKKRVYIVRYPVAFKTCPFGEWVRQAMRKGETHEQAVQSYSRCPKQNTVAMPEDDLEIAAIDYSI